LRDIKVGFAFNVETAVASYHPPLLISVHGIRTHAPWQKLVGEVAADWNIKVVSFEYGYFTAPQFLLGPSRKKKVRQFYDWYASALRENQDKVDIGDFKKRPSVVAHSFGTYILVNCMLKRRDVKFDKIILCGSILPEDFDWSILFGRDQVNCVRNECGHQDFWAGMVGTLVPNTGSSGKKGFTFKSGNFKQEHFEFEHSDSLVRQHMRTGWFPFLTKPPSGLVVKNGRDFDDLKRLNATLDDTHEIDLKHYKNLPHYSEVDIPRGLSMTWIDINPDIYTFIFDRKDKEVKGYINAMPVEDNLFNKIKQSGDVKDNEITAAELVPFHTDQRLKMYLMSIAIDPDARKASQGLFQEPFEKLLWGFFDKLIWYAIDCRIRVTELVAVGWTEQGKQLCKWFHMTEVAKDPFSNPVYWMSLEPKTLLKEKRLFAGMERLLKTYAEFDRRYPPV